MPKFSKRSVFLLVCALSSLVVWIHLRTAYEKPPDAERRAHHFHKKLEGTGVILATKGGIGNQLFQYACSYALAREGNSTLYHFIPGSPKRNGSDMWNPLISPHREFSHQKREFVLDKFQVPLTHFVDSSTILNQSSIAYLSDLQLLFRNYANKPFLQLSSDAYCASLATWIDYKDEILPMFQLRQDVVQQFPPYVASLEKEIEQAAESVAVHVRRQDAAASTSGYDVPISYQRTAIRRLIKILNNGGMWKFGSPPTPKLFVFSDDIDYAREKLQDLAQAHEFVFVSDFPDEVGNRTTSIQDFFLMTRCKHFIIPCSTFSWWAAWLATNWKGSLFRKSERIVIASAFNPKFLEHWEDKEVRDFRSMQHSRLYHPKEWIIINPFEGERSG